MNPVIPFTPGFIRAARRLGLASSVLIMSGSAVAALNVSQSGASMPVNQADAITSVSQPVQTGSGMVLSSYDTNVNFDDVTADTLNELMSQPQYVEARINRNGAGLTGDILPQVVSELGYDDFTIADQRLLSGTLPSAVTLALACHNSSAVWQLNMNDIEVNLPLDQHSVAAIFTDTGRINTDLALDDFSLEFELQFYYPDNVGGFYCDTLNMGTTYNFRVNVNVEGASGEFDVLVDAVSGHPVVSEIKKFELDVDSVSFDSSFLTSLTNLGIGISNLFGSGCSSLTQCVNDALDDELTGNVTLQNQLKDAVNAAIERTLNIEGGFNIGASQVDYAVVLEDVTGDNGLDRLTSAWEVEFDIDGVDDACAAGLTKTLFFANNGITTGNDFELVVPFRTFTDLLYEMGKKGVFCQSAVIPGTPLGTATAAVAPTGHVDVVSVSDNVLELTLPMTASVSASSATGSIGADLVVVAEMTPVCGSGLSLQVLDVAFENVAGTIEWTVLGQDVVLDATGFVSGVADDLAEDIEAALDDEIALLPESFGLADIARYVATGDIVSNSSAIALGLNVVSVDPNCN